MTLSRRYTRDILGIFVLALMLLMGCSDEGSESGFNSSPDADADLDTEDVESGDDDFEDGTEPKNDAGAGEAIGESSDSVSSSGDGDVATSQNDAVGGEEGEVIDSGEEDASAECESSLDCDDGNPCAKGLCIGGTCEWIPISVFCDDGSLCTVNDICVGLDCVGEDLVCNDGDPCTQDACDPQVGCSHNVLDPACYDEVPCDGENCDDPCLSGDEEACAAQSQVAQVVAGGQFTCARTVGGDVWCWGSNTQGQLGNGSTLTYIVPSKVIGISNATDISAGFGHACAALENGEVRCWGGNTWGQLGDGTTTGSLATTVAGLTDVVQVAAGTAHTCGLNASGRVYCWGQGTFGQLGNGEAKSYSTPVEVQGIQSASQITSGGHHSCAVFGGGFLSCWGYNASGQLGNVSVDGLEVEPAPVFDQTNVVMVDAYGDTTCAVSAAGELSCWGSNNSAKLGIVAQDVPGSLVPVLINGMGEAVSVVVGEQHVCALLSFEGYVSCWGVNDFIVETQGEDAAKPTHISGLSEALFITSGQQHMCALHEEGEVSCWGTNINGQLGNGGKTSSYDPTSVVGLP